MNTQTKHTPGPWAVMDNTAEPFGQLLVESERDGAVALCYTVERDETAAPLECIENARLIAAAPDLLAALQDLLSAIEETYDNRHEIRAAQDAIAKATG
jgi:hypothetical protein